MADLFGTYDKRIKLTIDHTKIDDTLTDFPVTVFFTAAQAEEIFTEFDADEDFDRGQFALGDDTLLKAEKEWFSYYSFNVLTGGTASADNEYSGDYNADKAFDNNEGTRWATQPTAYPHWLKYDLGVSVTKTVSKIRIKMYTDANNDSKSFTFAGSNNDSDWTTLLLDQTADSDAWQEFLFSNTTAYRYYKINWTDDWSGTNDSCSVFEIEGMEAEPKAIYHVKIPSVSSSVDTDYYFYYDNNADHNTSYIGIIGSATAAEVWVDYAAVYHMADNTTSTILDSTSNNNDGTKTSANNPIEASGKIGQGQDFSDDAITHPTLLDVMPDDLTMEALIKTSTVIPDAQYIVQKENITGEDRISLGLEGNKPRIWGEAGNAGNVTLLGTDNMAIDTFYYVAGVHTHTAALKLYLNTTEYTGNVLGNINDGTDKDFYIGRDWQDNWEFNGVIDEVRISSIARTAAWLKATYNSLWDSLLTYGSEETKPVEEEGNALFWFNF